MSLINIFENKYIEFAIILYIINLIKTIITVQSRKLDLMWTEMMSSY